MGRRFRRLVGYRGVQTFALEPVDLDAANAHTADTADTTSNASNAGTASAAVVAAVVQARQTAHSHGARSVRLQMMLRVLRMLQVGLRLLRVRGTVGRRGGRSARVHAVASGRFAGAGTTGIGTRTCRWVAVRPAGQSIVTDGAATTRAPTAACPSST